MKLLHAKWMAVFALIPCLWPLAPASAQSNTLTRIVSIPAGGPFYVDGTYYVGATTAIWPAYSVHTLSVPPGVQTLLESKTQGVFTGWQWNSGSSPLQTLTVVADPSITQYNVLYSVGFNLNVNCTGTSGTVYANGAPIACGLVAFPAGTPLVLTGVPAPGYVFAGWTPAPGQTVNGTVNTLTLNGSVQVNPLFLPAAPANIVSNPAGLRVLVDGAKSS